MMHAFLQTLERRLWLGLVVPLPVAECMNPVSIEEMTSLSPLRDQQAPDVTELLVAPSDPMISAGSGRPTVAWNISVGGPLPAVAAARRFGRAIAANTGRTCARVIQGRPGTDTLSSINGEADVSAVRAHRPVGLRRTNSDLDHVQRARLQPDAALLGDSAEGLDTLPQRLIMVLLPGDSRVGQLTTPRDYLPLPSRRPNRNQILTVSKRFVMRCLAPSYLSRSGPKSASMLPLPYAVSTTASWCCRLLRIGSCWTTRCDCRGEHHVKTLAAEAYSTYLGRLQDAEVRILKPYS